MLNINVTITNRPRPNSQLKQTAKIFTEPWAVLDIRLGRFGCSCGPFLTWLWAVLDQDYGLFWFTGRFGHFPFHQHSQPAPMHQQAPAAGGQGRGPWCYTPCLRREREALARCCSSRQVHRMYSVAPAMAVRCSRFPRESSRFSFPENRE